MSLKRKKQGAGQYDMIAANGIQNTFTGTKAEVEAAMQAGTIVEGMIVYITDDNGANTDASKIAYDNTPSGLDADDVQEAIDEVANDLSTVSSNLLANNTTAGISDVPFRFGCTDDGKFGYIIEEGGADTVVPFSGADNIICVNSTDCFDNIQFTKQDSGNSGTMYSDNDTNLVVIAGGASTGGTYYTHKAIFTSDIISSGVFYTDFYGYSGGGYSPTYSASIEINHSDSTSETYNYSSGDSHFIIVKNGDSITAIVNANSPGNWGGNLYIYPYVFESE